MYILYTLNSLLITRCKKEKKSVVAKYLESFYLVIRPT